MGGSSNLSLAWQVPDLPMSLCARLLLVVAVVQMLMVASEDQCPCHARRLAGNSTSLRGDQNARKLADKADWEAYAVEMRKKIEKAVWDADVKPELTARCEQSGCGMHCDTCSIVYHACCCKEW